MERSSMTQPDQDREQSTGDLVKMMTEQVSVLIRDELKLAQLEMTGKGKQAAHAEGRASAARAGCSRRQGRRGRDQGKGTPMTGPETAPEIQQEIEQTRERLGQTVEQLAAKADVKARTQAKVAEVKTRARVKAGEASERVRRNETVRRDWPLALIAAGILVMGAALARRRRTT